MYETIDHYIRNGSPIYGCLLDCTKAFDTVQHSKLFKKLLDAKVPPIIVRLLIFIYDNQSADVSWKGKFSREFSLKNGVRQGAVISPLFFCFYMNDLFELLEGSGNGCYIDHFFAGVFGYADDLLLLCPSRTGLQEMLDTTEEYARSHKISFSTNILPAKSKTKGIVFSKKKQVCDPAPLSLSGNSLPWVSSAKYLGNTITSNLVGSSQDCKVKRAQYIEKYCEILQEFPTAHQEVKCRINFI